MSRPATDVHASQKRTRTASSFVAPADCPHPAAFGLQDDDHPSPRRRAKRPRPPPPPDLGSCKRKPAPTVSQVVPTLPCKDDEDGHLVYHLGDGLCPTDELPNGRYKILSELGEGTFGKVVECWDRSVGFRVAVKIIRSVPKYRDAAKLEIDVLEHLEANDPNGWYHCVRLLDYFDYRNHVCIVFEKLGPSLYEQLRRNGFRPFSLDQVRGFAYQLLESVHFVHSLTLIHTDLKPENILLADPDTASFSPEVPKIQCTDVGTTHMNDNQIIPCRPTSDFSDPSLCSRLHGTGVNNSVCAVSPQLCPSDSSGSLQYPGMGIKLIDFGSATFQARHHSAVISTRHYRAPEVILGLGWTYPCDLWSVGCILVELFTGQALFQTHENLEHLAMMHVVLGPIPDSMIDRADSSSQKYFTPAAAVSSKLRGQFSHRGTKGTRGRRRQSSRVAKSDAKNKYISRAGKREDVVTNGLGNLSKLNRVTSIVNKKSHVRGNKEHLEKNIITDSDVCDINAITDCDRASQDTNIQPSSRMLNWPAGASSVGSVKAVKRVKCLADIVRDAGGPSTFLDLVRRLLAFDPDRRCTPAEALKHPFFREAPLNHVFACNGHPVEQTLSSEGESTICGSGNGGCVTPYVEAGRDGQPQMHAGNSGMTMVPQNNPESNYRFVCVSGFGQLQPHLSFMYQSHNPGHARQQVDENVSGPTAMVPQMHMPCHGMPPQSSLGMIFPSGITDSGDIVGHPVCTTQYYIDSRGPMMPCGGFPVPAYNPSSLGTQAGYDCAPQWMTSIGHAVPNHFQYHETQMESTDALGVTTSNEECDFGNAQGLDSRGHCSCDQESYQKAPFEANIVEVEEFARDPHDQDIRSTDDVASALLGKSRGKNRIDDACSCKFQSSSTSGAVGTEHSSKRSDDSILVGHSAAVCGELSDVTAVTFGMYGNSSECHLNPA